MNYVIENEKLRVEVTDFGAELQSVKGKKTGFEYLWQGNPELWRNRATVLFPICGRLYQGKYRYEGKEYEMGLHGFARNFTFNIEEKTDTAITLALCSDVQTKDSYPFDFKFCVTYSLNGNTLTTKFDISNLSDKVLPFSVGGHPGFNVPFNSDEQFEDYYITFEKVKDYEYLLFTENKLCSGKTAKLNTENGVLKLRHDLFDNDALFILDECNSVTLKSDKNSQSIKVTYKDLTHLGLWHTQFEKAPFVCIEPWHGSPSVDGEIDDFATKRDMITLNSGETRSVGFDITVTE